MSYVDLCSEDPSYECGEADCAPCALKRAKREQEIAQVFQRPTGRISAEERRHQETAIEKGKECQTLTIDAMKAIEEGRPQDALKLLGSLMKAGAAGIQAAQAADKAKRAKRAKRGN